MEVITQDSKLMQSGANQRYFRECSNIQYDVMNGSNFANSIIEGFMECLAFGTANMLTLEDEQDEVRYTNIPYEQSNYEEDSRGRVCTVYRNFRFTALQCWDMWGERCSKEIKDAMRDHKYHMTFDLLHFVGKRDVYNPYKKDKNNMPWRSIWIVKKEQHQLEEGGFLENPYAVWRFWKDSNDVRGFSPCMDVLAAAKLVNGEKRTFLRMAMKKSDPAMMMPNRGWLNKPNFNPSAMNYYDAKHTNPDALKAIENRGDAQVSIEALQMEQTEIDAGLFIPQFESISNITKHMTIPEVQQRISENMYQLSPVIGIALNEYLDPINLRTFSLLDRRGIFPDPPATLKGMSYKDLSIKYLSPLAKAQRQSEMIGLNAFMQVAAEMINFIPTVKDLINGDWLTKHIAEVQGVDPRVFYDDDYVKKVRQQNAKIQMAAQKAAIAEQATKAGHNAAQAGKASKEAEMVGAK